MAGANKSLRVVHAKTGELISLGTPSAHRLPARACATHLSPRAAMVLSCPVLSCRPVPAAHAEVLTGLQFTADGQRVVTVAVDGTIAVWRVEMPKPAPKKPAPGDIVFGPDPTAAAAAAAVEVVSQPVAPSGPRLPTWAQALVGRGAAAAPADVATPPRPQGRWAQVCTRGVEYGGSATSSHRALRVTHGVAVSDPASALRPTASRLQPCMATASC